MLGWPPLHSLQVPSPRHLGNSGLGCSGCCSTWYHFSTGFHGYNMIIHGFFIVDYPCVFMVFHGFPAWFNHGASAEHQIGSANTVTKCHQMSPTQPPRPAASAGSRAQSHEPERSEREMACPQPQTCVLLDITSAPACLAIHNCSDSVSCHRKIWVLQGQSIILAGSEWFLMLDPILIRPYV